ncbi:Fc.00g077860.m01.CDS01 [Cosmosporella sp. VM-42]
MPSSVPAPQQMPREPAPVAFPTPATRTSADQPRAMEPMTMESQPMSLRGGKGDGGAICCGICAGLCCFECLDCCC